MAGRRKLEDTRWRQPGEREDDVRLRVSIYPLLTSVDPSLASEYREFIPQKLRSLRELLLDDPVIARAADFSDGQWPIGLEVAPRPPHSPRMLSTVMGSQASGLAGYGVTVQEVSATLTPCWLQRAAVCLLGFHGFPSPVFSHRCIQEPRNPGMPRHLRYLCGRRTRAPARPPRCTGPALAGAFLPVAVAEPDAEGPVGAVAGAWIVALGAVRFQGAPVEPALCTCPGSS